MNFIRQSLKTVKIGITMKKVAATILELNKKLQPHRMGDVIDVVEI